MCQVAQPRTVFRLVSLSRVVYLALLHDDGAFHAAMAQAATMAAVKRIGPWGLCQVLDRRRFSLFEQPAIVRGRKN